MTSCWLCLQYSYCELCIRPNGSFSEACFASDQNNSAIFDSAPGVEGDLALFVTIDSCDDLGYAEAYLFEENFSRPIAGTLIFCRGQRELSESMSDAAKWYSTVLHEIFHIVPLDESTYCMSVRMLINDRTLIYIKSPNGIQWKENLTMTGYWFTCRLLS